MRVDRALISVSDKFALEDFARGLADQGIEIIASAGTRAALSAEGIPALPVSQITGYDDSFLSGRVKTLQARIYAGILADREDEDHMADLMSHDIKTIDLVCVNLYSFGSTDQAYSESRSAIGQIDIGGPMIIRAAALNHRHVAVIVRPALYSEILDLLERNDRELPEDFLGKLAAQAFAHVASYEARVSEWFSNNFDGA